MTQHEQQQMYRAGLAQLRAEKNQQSRDKFNREWTIASLYKRVPATETPKSA